MKGLSYTASSVSVSDGVLSRTSEDAGETRGGGAAPASSVACHSSPLAPASLKVTGREATRRTCSSTSRTLRRAAHAAAQEGERRRFDALAQARKPAAKRACLVAYATANPIHLLATRSHHRPATSIMANESR